MVIGQHLARLLGAAIVLVALIVAPSLAFAHTGHDHGAPAAHKVALLAKDAAPQAAATATAELKALPASSLPRSDGLGCPDCNCCSGVPCTTCCGALALPEIAVSVPPSASIPIALPISPPSPSLAPDGPRRPPRSFA